MAISYNEKIKKINDDRILMLNTVKDNITKNNMSLFDNLNNVVMTLNEDEINTKKYKSIIKAKQFIFDLVEQIINASSIEDIINLRKKINYYINKIKKELAERNINEELLNKMNDSVDYLRTDINRYVRFLKRENNLSEISELYEKIDNLLPEDINRLKKLISNEVRYTKRNMLSINNYQKRNSNKKKKDTLSSDKENGSENLLETNESKDELLMDLQNSFVNQSIDETALDEQNIELTYDELMQRINRYLSIYQLSEISGYDGNFFKKCFVFFKNIPRYILNKKTINRAECDYNVYYHGDDLERFIIYSKRYNSIQLALELIFRESSLSKREVECLFDHQKCVNWIIEFCDYKNDDLRNNKELVNSK